MIIRLADMTGRLIAFSSSNSQKGRYGNGELVYYTLSALLPQNHDKVCGVFAHSHKARRLALKESK